MSDTVSFAELDGQHVELLPARTVLSMFYTQLPVGDASTTTSNGADSGGKGPNLNPVALLGLTSSSDGASGTSTGGGTGAAGS